MIGSTPEQFAAAIRSEVSRMGKVIKDAGYSRRLSPLRRRPPPGFGLTRYSIIQAED